MRIIESDTIKRKKKKKSKVDQKFKSYWSILEPPDYVKDMTAKVNDKNGKS